MTRINQRDEINVKLSFQCSVNKITKVKTNKGATIDYKWKK